jgi:hypothetical protein
LLTALAWRHFHKWPITERFVSEVRAAASAVGQQIEVLHVSAGREIDTAFASLARNPVDALLVGPSPLANDRRVADRAGALCVEGLKLPAEVFFTSRRGKIPSLTRANEFALERGPRFRHGCFPFC